MSGWRANGGYLGPRPTGPSLSAASGWWDSRSQFRNQRDGQWPTVGDQYWSNVSLLLHMDGSDGSTTFTDSSSNAHTVTANGDAQIDTAQSQFGGASGLLDGTGDYLATADSSAWAFGTGDLTIEFWLRVASFSGGIYYMSQNSGTSPNWYIFSDSATLFRFGRHGAAQYTGFTTSLSTGQWYYVAIVRSGTTMRIFLDGVSQTLTNVGGGVGSFNFSSTTSLHIGGLSSGGNRYNGHLDEIRITKSARYAENYTSPAEPFPNGP
jgi:hypothetical protein